MRTHGKKALSVLLSALLLCTLFAPVSGLFSLQANAAELPAFAADYLLGQYYSLNWDAEGNDIWGWYDEAIAQYNGLEWCSGDGYATFNSAENGYYIHNAYVRIANNDLFRGVSDSTGLTVAFRYIPNVANDHRHILSLGANEYTGSSNANNHFYISATKSWRQNANGNSFNTVPFIGYVDNNGTEHINACPPASAPVFATGTAYDVVITISATEGIKYNINGTEYNAVYLNSNLNDQLPYIKDFLNAVSGWRYNYIGCSRWADGNFSGWLKNLRIYGKAFTKAQIDQSAAAYFTANFETLADNAEASLNAALLDKPAFEAKAYHCADEAVNGYNNLAFAAANDTNWGVEYEQDNAHYTFAMPNYVVMVYDGVEGHTPKSPIYLQRKGDRALDYMAVNLDGNNSIIRFDGDWVGYTDENYNNWQGYQLWPYATPQTGPNYIDYLIRDRNDLHRYMTSNQGNTTRRGYGNALVYHGTGNTDAYFEAFMNLPMKYSHTYWPTVGSTQVDAYDNVKATGTILVLNYKPVYDILDAAKNFYNTQIKDQEWKYTEASLKQAMVALYLLGNCNPNNYAYNSPIASVKQCAREMKLALAEYARINLVKKSGAVTFNNEDGTLYQTVTADYGDTFTVPAVPAKASTAQYDYTDPVWSPAITAGSTPVMSDDYAGGTYTAAYTSSLRSYAVRFFDLDNNQIGDAQSVNYGGAATEAALPGKAPDADYHYTVAWDTAFDNITADTDVHAVATPVSHSGGTATCLEQAKCETCQTSYGDLGDHAYGTLNEAVTPGCTAPGNIAYYECSVCHHTFNEAFVEVADVTLPAGHVYGEWISETPATCAAAGTLGHYHCSGCGTDFDAQYNVIDDLTIPKADHQYGAWVSNGDGTHTKVCANCPEGTEGHAVTESCAGGTATCYAKAVCDVCHSEYGDLAAHQYGDWDSNGDGTHTKVCANCPAEAEGHSVTEDCSEGTPATCEHKAVCGVCGGEYGELAAHTYGEWVNEIPASCSGEGTLGHYHCDICGKDFDEDYNELEDITIPAAHVYGEWIDETPATCAAAGEKGHYHCALCQKDFDADHNVIEDLTIQKAEHQYGGWNSNGDGTHTKTCANCPEGAEGHSMNGTCDGTATCLQKATCSVCGGAYGELADHSYGEWIAPKNASCTEDGCIGHYHCAVCGKDFDADYALIEENVTIPAPGHTYGDWIEQTAPGCTTNGVKGHYHCSVCGKDLDADYNEIASLTIPAAHHPVFVAEVPATETETGVIAHYDCSVCGKHFRESACVHELFDADMVIPATGGNETPTPHGAGQCQLCGQYHDSSVWGRVSAFVHLVVYLIMRIMGKI